jgi:transcriptional regulator with XRE-family HTH domain
MNRGWNAKGLLAAHWDKVGKRDGLAAATGITGETLSGYNSGSRPLGKKNATKIAAVLGVSLLDLGAPEAEADDPPSQAALVLLAELSAEVKRLSADLVAAQQRLEKLESQRGPRGSAASRRTRKAAP